MSIFYNELVEFVVVVMVKMVLKLLLVVGLIFIVECFVKEVLM